MNNLYNKFGQNNDDVILLAVVIAPESYLNSNDSAGIVNAYKSYNHTPEFPFILYSDGGASIAGLFASPNAGGPTWMMHPDREYERLSSYNDESYMTNAMNAAIGDDCNEGTVTPTYSITVNQGTGSGDYESGETFTITAASKSGFTFQAWSGDIQYLDNAFSASATVTMPAQDIVVTATYEENSVTIDTINPSDNLLEWAGWGVGVDTFGSAVDTGDVLWDNSTVSGAFTITASDSAANKWSWGSMNAWLPEGADNNLRDVNYIKVTYSSTGAFQLSLPQPGLSESGESFMMTLPETSGGESTVLLKVSDFAKPDWSSNSMALDLSAVQELAFEPVADYEGSNHSITVSEVILYNYQGETVDITTPAKIITGEKIGFNLIGSSLYLNNLSGGAASVKLYSATGRLLMTSELTAKEAVVQLPASLAGGVYLVNIEGEGVNTTTPILLK